MTTNVLIVDDHALMRIALRHALDRKPGCSVVGEATTGAAALEHIRDLKPNLVVMDIHLPDGSGLEISRRILIDDSSARILIYSGDVSRNLIDEALAIGVCGYLSKGCSLEELLQAVDAVLEGRLYLSADLSGEIIKDYRKSLLSETRPGKPALSDQERCLLRLVSDGRRNKEIATELGISEKSVEAHRSRLMKRLECSSAAELVRYAIREGIASL